MICSFSIMKSNRVVLQAFFAFTFLVIASGLNNNTWFVPSNTTGRAMQPDIPFMMFINEIYRANYCQNKTCPVWNCSDDSVIIHGSCCKCPNIFGDDVPVLCVNNLECPRLMKDLCTKYNLMILCCCSRINDNYYNYST
ncbi:PREDICTED: uncharacterized protein LOC107167778 [Diuraphis noxia]|uniref:uncharacterized protein LOC107167778 n=1 Tax=Diuraphis noxia TaxID=143948 RepID=UPI0007635BC9|nr:PREDICTED: uncharacterized protein LOC107167778 [Diuraphis noxia]